MKKTLLITLFATMISSLSANAEQDPLGFVSAARWPNVSPQTALDAIQASGGRIVDTISIGRVEFYLIQPAGSVSNFIQRASATQAFRLVQEEKPLQFPSPVPIPREPIPPVKQRVHAAEKRDGQVQPLAVTPSDMLFTNQWALHNIDAPEAWDHTFGDPSVVVAVLDSGIDYTHPDLDDNIWVNEAELNGLPAWDDDFNNVVDDVHGAYITPIYSPLPLSPSIGFGDPFQLDTWGHGTHVAGIIAAEINNVTGFETLPLWEGGGNTVGVAPGVKIMPVSIGAIPSPEGPRFLPWSITLSIHYAVYNGADIINMSLGADGLLGLIVNNLGMVFLAMAEAEFMGVTVVAATGNSDTEVGYPAGYSTTLAVGSVTDDDERSYFSNYGTALDVVAPGHGIWSTVPTYPVGGAATNNYDYFYGTSMASPAAAGVAALVKSVAPGTTPAQMREVVCSTCDYIADPDGDGTVSEDEEPTTSNPYGLPWNQYTGFGRVNAYSAVCLAKFPSRPTVQSVAFPGGVTDDVTVTFSEPMWPSSLSSSNITLTGSSSGGHVCTFSLDSPGTTLTISHASGFVPGETLTLTLSTGVLDAGKQSLLTSFSDVLQVGSTPPTAWIQSITPSSITQGEGDVTFDGSASSAITPGATLTTYKWTSSLDGQLYSGGNSSFTRDSSLLSAGQHTISLQVRDSNGLWSQTSAEGTLNVYEPGPDEGHDLRFDSITLDENVVAVNHDFAVDVMISNDGDYTEDSFTILYTLRNESGAIMDQETESAWSLAAGRTQGPGWVYLDPSSGYQGPVRIEVTINTPLDEDRSNNDGTASGYVGTLPAYDGYYGASWNYAPGGSDIVEGSYRIRPLYDSGSRVTVEVVKGADSWTGDINWYGVALFDQNRLAVAYYGRNSNPSYYGFGIFQYNESAVWLSDEHVTTYEGEQCEFIVNRQSDSSTYCSDWYISSSGDGSTVRTWSHDDERIDNTTHRLWITPPNDAVGHYDFWLANCWSWGGSSYDGTTKRLDNGLGVIASLTVYADDPPNTVINSGPSSTNAQNSATFGYGGSDDRTAVGSLTYSYRLLGHQDSWSSYASTTSKSYSDLTNGSYTFEVRAKDTKGQVDPSPAQREFTVDVQNLPSTPANVTPSHLASVRGTSEIALQGNAFNDTDPGATHQASEFLVRLDTGNYTSPAWNSGILGALTTATIPAGDLPQGTYWWQCRYRDNTDRWSEPSGETSFTILENHAPSAEARTVSVVHDRSVAISLPASDPNGDPITCSMLSDPTSGGTVVSNGSLNATYTPPASFVGTDTFTYQVTDGLLDSSVATVTVDVVNHSPYANTVLVVVESGERTTLSLPGGDADGDGLSYTIDAPPDNGTLFTDDLANGNIDYQSAPGFNADDALTYSISDGIATDTGTVSLVVSDPNNMTIDLVEDALGRLAVKYPAIAGFTYRVQYCNALSEDWQDLALGTVGDGTMRLKADTTAELPLSRMYRIIVEVP